MAITNYTAGSYYSYCYVSSYSFKDLSKLTGIYTERNVVNIPYPAPEELSDNPPIRNRSIRSGKADRHWWPQGTEINDLIYWPPNLTDYSPVLIICEGESSVIALTGAELRVRNQGKKQKPTFPAFRAAGTPGSRTTGGGWWWQQLVEQAQHAESVYLWPDLTEDGHLDTGGVIWYPAMSKKLADENIPFRVIKNIQDPRDWVGNLKPGKAVPITDLFQDAYHPNELTDWVEESKKATSGTKPGSDKKTASQNMFGTGKPPKKTAKQKKNKKSGNRITTFQEATEEAKRLLPLENLIEQLTGQTVNFGNDGEAKIHCPTTTHEDKKPSCSVSQTKGVYHCFSCGASGNVLNLLSDHTGITNYKELAAEYRRRAGVPEPEPRKNTKNGDQWVDTPPDYAYDNPDAPGNHREYTSNNNPESTHTATTVSDNLLIIDQPFTHNYELLEKQLHHLGVRWRYNIRALAAEWAPLEEAKWERINDLKESQFYDDIATKVYERNPSTDKMKPFYWVGQKRTDSAQAYLARHIVDPFMMYLEALPEWDGENRLDDLLIKCFDLSADTSEELAAWASASVLLCAVWRTYKPGTKHDEMVILVGPQGCGKSLYCKFLIPEKYQQDWFSDSLTLNIQGTGKEQVEATLGRVIVEAAELTGFRRSDLEAAKSYLSRSDDGSIRLAYAKKPEPMPRRFALVGTADRLEGALPSDPAGLRRWVPIEIVDGPPKRVLSYLNENREMLWAEALFRYNQKEPAYLPYNLRDIQRLTADLHRDRDELVEALVEEHLQMDGYVQVAAVLNQDTTRSVSPNRIRNECRRRGMNSVQKRLPGQKNPVRVWVPDEKDDPKDGTSIPDSVARVAAVSADDIF